MSDETRPRFWTVTLEVTTVIQAETAHKAIEQAEVLREEIVRNDNPEIFVDGQVRTRANLPDGWNGSELPWGGDGETPIGEMLEGGDQDGTAGDTCAQVYREDRCTFEIEAREATEENDRLRARVQPRRVSGEQVISLVDRLIEEAGGVARGDAPCVEEARSAVLYAFGIEITPTERRPDQ